jgi:ribonuclease P protein component
MPPKRLRLSREEFAAAATGRRATSAHFSVTVRKTKQTGGIAAVISKKVAKKSVDRHLLKRRILEILRPHTSPDHALIIYARAGAPALPFQALKQELSELVTRAIG